MTFRWGASTSLFRRMSGLFGLLVTVPLIISGIVLSLAGWRVVYDNRDSMARAGHDALGMATAKYQQTAQSTLKKGAQDVAETGKTELQHTSDQLAETARAAARENAKSLYTDGETAVKQATQKVAEVGAGSLNDSLGALATMSEKSIRETNQQFQRSMQSKLTASQGTIQQNLRDATFHTWDISVARRLGAIQEAETRQENKLVLKLQVPLKMVAVLRTPDEAAPILNSSVRKGMPEVARVVLVGATGTEYARVPDGDLAAGEEVDWAKPGTPEARTREALFSRDEAVLQEPVRFDPRSGLWVRRIVHKIVVSDSGTEVPPSMLMGAEKTTPQYMPFLVVDLSLNGVVDLGIADPLPTGMQALVVQAGTGKIISSHDPKQINTVNDSVQKELASLTGKDPTQFHQDNPFKFHYSADGEEMLGRAVYWTDLGCWTVLLQPRREILRPVEELEKGINQAWQDSLKQVAKESGAALDRSKEDWNKKREALTQHAESSMQDQASIQSNRIHATLGQSEKQVLGRLDNKIDRQVDEIKKTAGKGMVDQAGKIANDGYQSVVKNAENWTKLGDQQIDDRARNLADQAAGRMLSYSASLIPLFLVLALFLATLTARSLVKPINRLLVGTQALATGEYDQRIKVHGNDELARLAIAFNDMASAIEQGQAQLQQSHDHLSAEKARIQGIVDSSPDGLAMLEPTGQVAFINPTALGLLDLDASTIPMAPFEVAMLPPPAAERLQECLGTVQDQEGVQEYEIAEPQRRVLQLREVKLRSQSGRSYGRLLHIHDITHERVIDEMKSDFISLVSHELRTPLTSILGFSSYMLTGRMGTVSDTQKTALESIHRQAKRLSAIISDFLDVSRIESGKIEMKKEPVALQNVASRVVEDLRPQANEKNIRVQAKVEEGSLPLVAMADEQRVAQVFTNLVGNALKFTEAQGAIDVSLARHNGEVICSVRDTGCGIPPDELDRVFDRFYQVEKVVTRKSGGTGLGLAIVKNIVEAHGGRIWIESELGKGTQVSFSLPAGS